MSASIVKRALELFEEKKQSNAKDKNEKCLTTNKYGLKKERKRLKKQNICNKIKTNLKDKKIESAIEKYRRKRIQDQTETNLYILQKLSERKPDFKTVDKLLKYKNEKLAKDKPTYEQKPESTVFTDEDFEKFDKEYNFI